MNRRSFLHTLGAAAVGLTLSRMLPGIAPAPPAVEAPSGWTSGVFLQRGDVFTIEGVFATNPVTGLLTGMQQRFVVTADVTDLESPLPSWPIVRNAPAFETYPPFYPWQVQPFAVGDYIGEATSVEI